MYVSTLCKLINLAFVVLFASLVRIAIITHVQFVSLITVAFCQTKYFSHPIFFGMCFYHKYEHRDQIDFWHLCNNSLTILLKNTFPDVTRGKPSFFFVEIDQQKLTIQNLLFNMINEFFRFIFCFL